MQGDPNETTRQYRTSLQGLVEPFFELRESLVLCEDHPQRVVSVILVTVIVSSSILSILEYLSVGLVIQRAVDIKPREGD